MVQVVLRHDHFKPNSTQINTHPVTTHDETQVKNIAVGFSLRVDALWVTVSWQGTDGLSLKGLGASDTVHV